MRSRQSLDIDPEICRAATLPGWFYRAPDVYDALRERVFVPSWQFLGSLDRVKVPGQAWPVTLLEGMLDEPIVLTRDRDDRVHCMSNVCTHRGTLVCEVEGSAVGGNHLRGRYHGRRFGLDGRMISMPEFEGVENFPSARDDLRRVPLGVWEKLAFASIAPAAALAVERTKVSFLSYVWDPSGLDRGAGSALDRVEREDEAIVESVQRGVRGRLYERGRYSPAREQGVHHFHRLVAEFMELDTARNAN